MRVSTRANKGRDTRVISGDEQAAPLPKKKAPPRKLHIPRNQAIPAIVRSPRWTLDLD